MITINTILSLWAGTGMKNMSGSGIRQGFLSGIELLSVTSPAKAFASLAKLATDTKASCTCLLQHQISHHYIIFQHFCHMTSFKSINFVSEVVKYDSPDLNRGGTSRENLCWVGYRVRKLKSGTSPGRVYPMRVGKTPQ